MTYVHDGDMTVSPLYPHDSLTRDSRVLDGIWQMVFRKAGSEDPAVMSASIPSEAEEVAVPASINEQVTDLRRYQHMDEVWMYRHFRLPPGWTGERVALRFGSVTYQCDVFVNGEFCGSHETGYTPFECLLPVSCGEQSDHLLAVRLDNGLSCETIPQGGVPPEVGGVAAWRVGNVPDVHYDFFPFMGIHRTVWLTRTPQTRLRQTRWTTRHLHRPCAQVRAWFAWEGCVDTVKVTLPDLGMERAWQVSPDQQEFTAELELEDVVPWCPEQPHLYKICIHLLKENALVDEYIFDFGFRTVAIEGAEFLLNGRPVCMKGFGRHEDVPVIGKGVTLPFLVRDFNLMEWTGANSFRTTHYPYSEEQMQMADRKGFLVVDEAAANTLSMKAVAEDPEQKQRLLERHLAHNTELIERDYNHPCVVAWSMGNECEMSRADSQGYMTRVVEHAKKLDPYRPVTMVAVTVREVEELEADAFDFIATNVYPGWYWSQGNLRVIQPWLTEYLDTLWERFGKPILLSEFGADAIPGLHRQPAVMWTEEYQVEMVEEILDVAETHPACFGAHVWNFADYLVGQHTGRVVLNWKGVFTRDRQPKMIAHRLCQRWAPEALESAARAGGSSDDIPDAIRYT